MSEQQLFDQSVRRAVYLEGLKQSEVNKFGKFLRQIDAYLRVQLTDTELTAFKRGRLETFLAEVAVAVGAIFTGFYESLFVSLEAVGVAEAVFEAKSLD
ncbi:MAG: hypothetical protein ACEQSD_08915, partial [Flavobacteriales bacterium]